MKHMHGYYSTDPLKNEVISNIVNSQSRDDFDTARNRAKEEGLESDDMVVAWTDFRQKLVFKGEGPF